MGARRATETGSEGQRSQSGWREAASVPPGEAILSTSPGRGALRGLRTPPAELEAWGMRSSERFTGCPHLGSPLPPGPAQNYNSRAALPPLSPAARRAPTGSLAPGNCSPWPCPSSSGGYPGAGYVQGDSRSPPPSTPFLSSFRNQLLAGTRNCIPLPNVSGLLCHPLEPLSFFPCGIETRDLSLGIQVIGGKLGI